MFNVLERLKSLKLELPEKYQRVCDRIAKIQRDDGPVRVGFEHTQVKNFAEVIRIRKATEDFFARLATVDRKNEVYWKTIGSLWVGRTELEDLPFSRKASESRRSRKRKPQEQLLKTLLVSHDPKETFRLILEYNHPQRILWKLLMNRDRRALLYGVRTKFALPLPPYLLTKHQFQQRPDLEQSGVGGGEVPSDHLSHEEEVTQELTRCPSPPQNRRVSVVETLLRSPGRGSSSDERILQEKSADESLFEERVLRRGSKANSHTRRSRFSDFRNSMSRQAAGETFPFADNEPFQDENEATVAPLTTVPEIDGSDSEDTDKAERPSEKHQRRASISDENEAAMANRRSTDIEDDGSGGMDQYRLQRLKIIFEESDTDDEPGLDINEFKQAMKKIIGENVPEREIELIFMKVDANCDGNVDWNEFLEYTLREFQERDLMTQLTKDTFFEKSPEVVVGSRNPREIRAVVYAPQHGFSKSTKDAANGRYYSMNREGEVICWSSDFKKIASFALIPDVRGKNTYIRANDMCLMPEIKVLVVSLTTADLHFFAYDDTKLDSCFSICSLKSPVLCLSYYHDEQESLLLLGDQNGKVNVIHFKNLHYDGLWGSLQLPHSNGPKASWDFLVKKGRANQIKGFLGSEWINQVQFVGALSAVVGCSADSHCSMCVIPLKKQREPTIFSQKHGFTCFDYSDFLNVIVTGSQNRVVQVWNPDNSTNPTMHFDGHEASVSKVTIFRDADFSVIISADANQTLKVWDVKDQSCLQTYECERTIPHYMTTFMVYNPAMDHIIYGARDIILLNRMDIHKKVAVDHVQRTHDQPVVGVLYNDLFECVVTACLESTIMVWNFLTGDKIIQFRNAHTVIENGKTVQVPIKSMCFDANKRRLVTCSSDGLVKLWNFNNGACLSFFDQLVGSDLNVVRYQKNRDLVITAGWSQYVFMVRDTRGEDDVEETEYKWEQVHRSDITALEFIYTTGSNLQCSDVSQSNEFSDPDIQPESPSSYIATKGERVIIKDVNVRSSLRNETDKEESGKSASETKAIPHSFENSNGIKSAPLAETTTDCEPTPDGIFNAADEACRSASESDTTNSNKSQDGSGAEELQKSSDDASYAVTASSDGEIIVWHLFTGEPICFLNTDGCPRSLTRKARDYYAAKLVSDFPQLELKDSGSIEHFLGLQTTQKVTRKSFAANAGDPVTVPKGTVCARNSVTCILVLDTRPVDDTSTASVLTASNDGFIRAWCIHHTNGGLKGLFFAARNLDGFVQTMATDEQNELLFTGDTSGYVQIWLLCEWVNAPERLQGHRHSFNPRSFPFMKRYEFFAPLLALRSNHMMQKAVPILDPVQRGMYVQPYILNSFRGHLHGVTAIQVIFPKKVIITSSFDCSVRLWHFSGLFMGTLGQPTDFRHDISEYDAELELSPSRETDEEEKSVEEIMCQEDDDKDEVLLKPKVIVPADIAEMGSSTTLHVLYGMQHKHTEIPESEMVKFMEEDSASVATFKDRDDFVAALGELAVGRHRFDEFKPGSFQYIGHRPSLKTKNDEDLIFTHAPLRNIANLELLQDVIPEKLFNYNLAKTQTDLLELLPLDLRRPFLALYKAGKLTGGALEDLKMLVSARETSPPPPKLPNRMRLRAERKVRLKEQRDSGKTGDYTHDKSSGKRTVSLGGRRRSQKRVITEQEVQETEHDIAVKGPESRPASEMDGGLPMSQGSSPVPTSSSSFVPNTVLPYKNKKISRPTPSKSIPYDRPASTISRMISRPQKRNQETATLTTSPTIGPTSPASTTPISLRQKSHMNISSVFHLKGETSSDMAVELSVRPSEINRIELSKLSPCEEEFREDLATEQSRNAKFDYLASVEKGNAQPTATDPYISIIKQDPEFMKTIQPMLKQSADSVKPAVRKVTINSAKSVDSMDRIQRVFRMPDFDTPLKTETKRSSRLSVPPGPRRLPSVIKGQIDHKSGKRSVTEVDLLAHQGNHFSKKRNLWGDQPSLPIFEQNSTCSPVRGIPPTGTPLKQSRQESLAPKKFLIEEKVRADGGIRKKRKTTALLLAGLYKKKRRVPKERPFDNRYLYRQLSDSVLNLYEPPAELPYDVIYAPVDVDSYLKSRKFYAKEQQAAWLEEQVEQKKRNVGVQRRSTGLALRGKEVGRQTSLQKLEHMMNQAREIERELGKTTEGR